MIDIHVCSFLGQHDNTLEITRQQQLQSNLLLLLLLSLLLLLLLSLLLVWIVILLILLVKTRATNNLEHEKQQSSLQAALPRTGRNQFGSILFGSGIFEDHRFGSVRFGQLILPVRRGSACIFRLGPVRLGSVPLPVHAGSEIKQFGSVRFGRFGSVSYSFLPRKQETTIVFASPRAQEQNCQ